MSEIDTKITEPLFRVLEKAVRDRTRKLVQGQTGQLLILRDIKVFKEIISSSLGIDISSAAEQKALSAGRKKALSLQLRFQKGDKNRFNAIVRRLPEVLPEGRLGENIFIVQSFASSIALVKTEIFNALARSGEVTREQASGVQSDIHRGHGVRGTAVSQIGIAKSMNKMGSSFGNQASQKLLLENLDAYMMKGSISLEQANELRSLTTDYSQIVTTKGALKVQYFSIIDFQHGKENVGVDSAAEKALVKVFREYIKYLAPQIVNAHGSSSLTEKIEKVLVDAIAGKPSKGKKVTRRKKNISKSSSGKSRAAQPRNAKGQFIKRAAQPRNAKGQFIKRAAPTAIKKAKGTAKGVSASPLALIVALNKGLHQAVRGNMGSPRLNNVSSRFSDSVEVTNIITPTRGFPIVDYTYMLYPYQTFEVGWARGSTQRDPRPLIDMSIREVATTVAFNKFHTRRS